MPPPTRPSSSAQRHTLEAEAAALAERQANQTPFEGPELAVKIVHACMGTETISEDEKLEITRAMLA